jgi:sortase A
MTLSHSIEKTFRLTGLVFVLVYLLFEVAGFVSSQSALSSFRAHESAVAPSARSTPPLDVSLWSPKRVVAYEKALLMKLDAPLAVLSVPRLGIEVPVYEGTDDLTLNRGAGRISGSARLDEAGNIGIAAHRDGFFRKLKDISKGDRILLSTGRTTYDYVVDDIEIVAPSNVSVLGPRPKPTLTLVTCYPFYFVGDAPKRYIVHAARVEVNDPTASNLTASKLSSAD